MSVREHNKIEGSSPLPSQTPVIGSKFLIKTSGDVFLNVVCPYNLNGHLLSLQSFNESIVSYP